MSAAADTSDSTMISILFDYGLNWQFVAQNWMTSSQIFSGFPQCLEAALSISDSQVQTYALQVYIPETYKGPADAAQLGTMWLGYIPSDLVDDLAAQIKAKQSAFYTGTTGLPAELAAHVDSSFAVTTYQDPNNGDNGSSSSGSSNGGATASSGSSKVRENAIIGIVSALGGITLLVLGYLVYRSVKQRQELAHRRLSDPDPASIPPPDHEFDRDSLGGQRRRSFYFAEDSLRGYGGQRAQEETYDHRVSPEGMRERRPVMPGAISTPILRENTMNW
ncbi:hypothetical protein GLOTRDRAFT_130042 [Gloeophyllum trabeum ATCC 11539]|uniref:Uncharacterized protein n=1 Tax=Gloeophyllum trabeum (strain ATCC 11539 / FP-39264 / Madison 617) TaxID=670483 RepID=S7Q3W4_GLOTA|nr:uncharacterized protein GLOTRDRAFT_130042 [Gloeophyllum trabeum ATCC 11539]EPQ54691.1 hypothetical protein GLOTRDRAFT_130042 [Gloeophyllum trabeum ATCC 11539]